MRFCLLCHGSSQLVFCECCLRHVRLAATPPEHRLAEVQGFLVETLFEWNLGNDRALRSLLVKLKGGKSVAAFQVLSEELARGELWHRPEAVLVPAPSRRGVDHAMRLAIILGGLKGLPVLHALERSTSHWSQKTLSRSSRRNVPIVAFRPAQEALGPYKEVILVDDIVTTGATAKRAFQVLGSPRHFRVWGLARRSLL